MLDPIFTQRMQSYLAQTSDQRDVAQGALLLFQLNGNAYLYHNALARPDKYAATIEHELKKHLQIRLDGLTRAQVAQLEQESLPRIQATLGAKPGSRTFLGSDKKQSIGSEQTTITTDTDHPAAQHLGKRPDHDTLPDSIKQLYERNGEIYYRMKSLYNQLLELEDAQPCDRYDLLKQLRSADDRYRANWKKYDEYKQV